MYFRLLGWEEVLAFKLRYKNVGKCKWQRFRDITILFPNGTQLDYLIGFPHPCSSFRIRPERILSCFHFHRKSHFISSEILSLKSAFILMFIWAFSNDAFHKKKRRPLAAFFLWILFHHKFFSIRLIIRDHLYIIHTSFILGGL